MSLSSYAARAIHMRCLWPPDRVMPFSPIWVQHVNTHLNYRRLTDRHLATERHPARDRTLRLLHSLWTDLGWPGRSQRECSREPYRTEPKLAEAHSSQSRRHGRDLWSDEPRSAGRAGGSICQSPLCRRHTPKTLWVKIVACRLTMWDTQSDISQGEWLLRLAVCRMSWHHINRSLATARILRRLVRGMVVLKVTSNLYRILGPGYEGSLQQLVRLRVSYLAHVCQTHQQDLCYTPCGCQLSQHHQIIPIAARESMMAMICMPIS